MRILAAAAAFSFALLALAAGARAEDFSGFYAGVNAGYAFDRQHGDRDIGPGPGSSGTVDDAKLPPSAASAAKAMQSTREGAAKGR